MTEKAKQLGNQPINHCLDNNSYAGEIKVFSDGLTKREYFAGLAMQGICVNAGRNTQSFDRLEKLAELSAKCADALLEELSKTK